MSDEYDQLDLRTPPPSDIRRDLEREQREQFSAFYRANITNLVGFLMSQGARTADAAEVAQETMVRLWASWSKIDSPMAWARVVAGRELVRRYSSIKEDHIDEQEFSALLGTSSDLDDWVESAAYQEALTALPPRQRQVLVWTMHGYSPIEISRELQIKDVTVRSNLRKARRAMALHLVKGEQQ